MVSLHSRIAAVLVMSMLLTAPVVAANASTFPGLPVRWYSAKDIAASSPLSRPRQPFPCLPMYFSPSDVEGGTSSVRSFTKNGKRYSIEVRDSGDASTAPFTFREFVPQQIGCQSKALQVFKNGKPYALYTNVLWGQGGWPPGTEFFSADGWRYASKRQALLLHNVVLEKGKWTERMRTIDLATKKFTYLPLDQCFIQGVPLDDGTVFAQYMESYDGAPTVSCLAKRDGSVLWKVHPLNVLGTSMPFLRGIGNDAVLLGLDFNSYVLMHNNVIPSETPERHRVIALDIAGKQRWATFLFPPRTEITGFVFNTSGDEGNPQFDVRALSWEKPAMRFRTKIYDAGVCCLGPWKWGPWQNMTLERVFNAK